MNTTEDKLSSLEHTVDTVAAGGAPKSKRGRKKSTQSKTTKKERRYV